jgi:hypothetical protein
MPFRLHHVWQRYETSFHSRGSGVVGLDFFADSTGSVWLDDVSLRTGDTSLFRRDFENGIVLLNYTVQPQEVSLETTYHRLLLLGSEVFDGAAVTSETLPPSDGRILLRRPPTDVPMLPATRTTLQPNRPNPFNPGTEIAFRLATTGPVRLAVYDVSGRLVRVLLQQTFSAPLEQRVQWDGRDTDGHPMPSGIYFYELRTPDFRQSRKMVLLR